MISEVTILNLQTAAALLMGYDYFVSEPLKTRANAFAQNAVLTYQSQQDKKLKEQVGIFLTWIPRFLSGLFYLIVCVGIVSFIHALTLPGTPEELQIVGLILLLLFTYFLWRAMDNIFNVFSKGIIPFTLPALIRVFTTFLLYSSKGAIAALGILFLIASFLCRYSNAGVF